MQLHVITRHPRIPGFALDDPYLEVAWLPIAGPTAVCFLRAVARRLDARHELHLAWAEIASSLGVSRGTGRNSPLGRTLTRLDRFRLLRWDEPAHTAHLPLQVPPVQHHQLDRLPDAAVVYHRLRVAELTTATLTS